MLSAAALAESGEPRSHGSFRALCSSTGCNGVSIFEDGRISPGGSVHLGCRREYFETGDVLAALLQFSPALAESDRAELTRACAEDSAPA